MGKTAITVSISIVEISYFPTTMSTPQPTATITALYKRNIGPSTTLTFDVSYYISTHIPLCNKLWGKYGLLPDWTVTETTPDAEYAYSVTIPWKNREGIDRALEDQEVTDVIMGDVKNFTNGYPVFLIGRVVN